MDTPSLRIGDAERERAAALLNTHVGAGRLDLDEFERRVDVVYAARTHGELALATVDLPAVVVPAADLPARAVSATGSTVRPARTAPDRLTLLRYAAWGPLVSTAVLCMIIWAATSLASGEPLYFWPMWVIGPWAATFLLGGSAVGGRCPLSLHAATRR